MKYTSLLFSTIVVLMIASGCWLGCSDSPECDSADPSLDLAECYMDDQSLESATQALTFAAGDRDTTQASNFDFERQPAETSLLPMLRKTCDRYIMRPRIRFNGRCPWVQNWTGSDFDSSDNGFCYYVWNGTNIMGPSSSEIEALAEYGMPKNRMGDLVTDSTEYIPRVSLAVGSVERTGLRVASPSSPETERPRRSSAQKRLPSSLNPACSLASPSSVQHFDFSTMGTIYTSRQELSCESHGWIWENEKCWTIITLPGGETGRRLITYVHPLEPSCGAACIHVLNRTMTAVGLPAGALGYIYFDEDLGTTGPAATIQVPKDAQEIFTMPLPAAPLGEYWVDWTADKQPLSATE